MSVNYFLNNDEKGFHTGYTDYYVCFGNLFLETSSWESIKPGSNIRRYRQLHEFKTLHYFEEGESLNTEMVGLLLEKFPWMNDIFHHEIFVTEEKKQIECWCFDLSKPADTVWFCLNVVRLIQQSSVKNNLKPLTEKGFDFWKAFCTLHSVYFGANWSGKGGLWYSYELNDTCLLSIAYMKEDTIKAIFEEPLQVLNKLPSVIESKMGFKPIIGYYDDEGDFFKGDPDEDYDELCYLEMLKVMEDGHLTEKEGWDYDDLYKEESDVSTENLPKIFGLDKKEEKIFKKIWE